MLAISNSTALIPFGIVTFLTWLPSLYDKLVIPEKVYSEVVIEGRGMPGAVEVEKAVKQGQIEVQMVTDLAGRSDLVTNYGLDLGEAEVITLALEVGADIAIIDEDKAWAVAKQFNDRFTTICLPFVLDRAKQLGFISSSLNALRDLKLTAKYHPAKAPMECWYKSHGWTQ